MIRCQLRVEAFVRPHHARFGVRFAHEAEGIVRQPYAERRLVEEPANCRRERRGIGRWKRKTRFLVEDHPIELWDLRTRDGPAGGHRLDRRDGEAFRQRRKHEHVHERKHLRHVGSKTGDADPIPEGLVGEVRGKARPQPAVAHDQKLRVRVPAKDEWDGLKKVYVTLLFDQPSDRTHHRPTLREPRARKKPSPVRGRTEP